MIFLLGDLSMGNIGLFMEKSSFMSWIFITWDQPESNLCGAENSMIPRWSYVSQDWSNP